MSAGGSPIGRRTALAAIATASVASLAGCGREASPATWDGGWIGAEHARGHRLRAAMSGTDGAGPSTVPVMAGYAAVLVVGAGVAGLACARALMQAGVDDLRVFDLEDSAGGNSRGHTLGGMHCPLGAHYLPLPGDTATEVAALLEDLGLRRTAGGRTVYDERHLCHSPQERLHIDGRWVEGLLPPVEALPAGERAATTDQYRRFSQAVEALSRRRLFAIPTARAGWGPELDALDRIAFTTWLDAQGLRAPALRWYLDHCCRDDYGAGSAQVSAWAGLHYFASRHGFQPPGTEPSIPESTPDGVLTWPEGNAWLTSRMAAPLGDRLRNGCVALRVDEGRHGVQVDLWCERTRQVERWSADQVVLATPLFVSARLLAAPPSAWTEAAAGLHHAPWLVGNLHLDAPLHDRPGAPPSWDSVVYPAGGMAARAELAFDPARLSLGYVDAMHQSTRAHAGPTVLTAYWALGGDDTDRLIASRRALLDDPWATWSARLLQDVARPHPDLPERVRRIDLMRYGHAMAIPSPGVRSSAALRAAPLTRGRVHAAHSDLSGYSVFEEAMYWGCDAARRVRNGFERPLSRASTPRSPTAAPARRG